MTYLKCLFFNFLIVFFVNHVLPGIEPGEHKLPHVGPDLIFAFSLGLLNSLIYTILKLVQQQRINFPKIALIALVINFFAYALLKFVPLGISVTSLEGFFIAAFVISLGSMLTNYLEWKHSCPKTPKPPAEPPRAP
jgi:uncharacterized membrane protein YvlD (DUF360 family)